MKRPPSERLAVRRCRPFFSHCCLPFFATSSSPLPRSFVCSFVHSFIASASFISFPCHLFCILFIGCCSILCVFFVLSGLSLSSCFSFAPLRLASSVSCQPIALVFKFPITHAIIFCLHWSSLLLVVALLVALIVCAARRPCLSRCLSRCSSFAFFMFRVTCISHLSFCLLLFCDFLMLCCPFFCSMFACSYCLHRQCLVVLFVSHTAFAACCILLVVACSCLSLSVSLSLCSRCLSPYFELVTRLTVFVMVMLLKASPASEA